MDRVTAFGSGAALLVFALACVEAGAYNCPAPMQRLSSGDCGLFPNDPDIMRVPAHNSDAVVARWPSPSGKPVRIINNSDYDIPVFLRTREEFQSFLDNLNKDPDLDSCEVVDQYWKNTRQCAYLARDGRVVPGSCKPWGLHTSSCNYSTLPMFFTCSGTSCGGTCSIDRSVDKHGVYWSGIYQGDVAYISVRRTSPPFAACEPGCLRESFNVKEGCTFLPWTVGPSAKHGEIRTVKDINNHLGSSTFVCTRLGSKWKWHMLRYTCPKCPGKVLHHGYCQRRI